MTVYASTVSAAIVRLREFVRDGADENPYHVGDTALVCDELERTRAALAGLLQCFDSVDRDELSEGAVDAARMLLRGAP